MEHIQNPFDIHVGRINALYENIWRNVSGIDFDGTLGFRAILVDAVVSMSNVDHSWTLLTECIDQHPEVEYNPNSGMAIRIGEDLRSLDNWLLEYKLFAQNRQRCYSWDMDKILNPDDPYYGLYLYMLLSKSDIYEIPSLLDYQLSHSFGQNLELFCGFLDRTVKHYEGVGLLSPVVCNALEGWKINGRHPIVPIIKKGRKSKNEGGDRQKEIAITMKLVASCMHYKATGGQIAKAFSLMTSYSAPGLEKALSALQTGNDSTFQFNEKDFNQVEKLLDVMKDKLLELKKNS